MQRQTTGISAAAPTKHGGQFQRGLAVLMMVAATVVAYWPSFRGALVFDDIPGIANNPTIRDLGRWDLMLVAVGPQGGTLSGRPVPNLTLALNYAISGDELWSYHAFNLLIHLCAGLALFGVVRRTLLRPRLVTRFGTHSFWLSLVIATVWSLHPLQTESVTYLVQRVESLMGLSYFLTLYCFVRAIDAPRPVRWQVGAFLACLTGMACKEVMASAPLLVWLYDCTFVADSWREAWHRRRWFHATLAGTWILLACLIAASGGRGGTAGYGAGLSSWHYALTQCRSVIVYLKLSLWPHPLVFDHNLSFATHLGEVWLQAVALAAILTVTVWLVVRRPIEGFVCSAFLLILAPTSSIVPVADAMVEHRMYLPVACLAVLAVLGFYSRVGRLVLPISVAGAVALGALTARRNLDYRSPLTLWADAARNAPENARAHNNLGAYLLEANRIDEAREQFTTALRLDPKYGSAHYNLGKLLEKTGRTSDALDAYETALRFNPKLADAEVNLANLLDRLGRSEEALPHYEKALRLDPQSGDIHGYLGAALLKLKRPGLAIDHLKASIDLDPDRAEVWCNLAKAAQQQSDPVAARRACDRALRLKPDFPEAHYVMGNLDAVAGDFSAAIMHFQRAIDLAPDYIAARNNLANAFLVNGQVESAIVQYRRILRDRPDDRAVQENLARALEIQTKAGAH